MLISELFPSLVISSAVRKETVGHLSLDPYIAGVGIFLPFGSAAPRYRLPLAPFSAVVEEADLLPIQVGHHPLVVVPVNLLLSLPPLHPCQLSLQGRESVPRGLVACPWSQGHLT